MNLQPRIDELLSFFEFEHLPAHLQDVSRPFGELAAQVAERNPASFETVEALRKLLESKDCAVRAALLASRKVMVCGVDCHEGDANCNGYCKGEADRPPAWKDPES